MKKMCKLLALVTAVCLLFVACGAKEAAPAQTLAPETVPAAAPVDLDLGLTSWTLEPSIWSSANGASVDLTATPVAYAEGLTASFVVRLEGEDVSNNPCQWNGTAFTSYADLNAEDGYCYYVVLDDGNGVQLTVEINTPTIPFNDALINLAASLESYCHATVSDAAFEEGKLTLTKGAVTIQVPRITDGGQAVTCTGAELVLNLDGGALTKVALDLPAELSTDGSYTVDIANVSFDIPALEGEHSLTLTLTAQLSDGVTLTDEETASWFYSDGDVHMTVG